MNDIASRLMRTIFETSRELEFFSEKELQMQIGHGRHLWRVALLKELIDNALDACESADILPEIEVVEDEDGFSVRDNGPGLPADTLTASLDYMKRVSDKAFYVSPTRGQLRNALKTLWAAPFVVNGERGCVEIWSQGQHHTVEVTLDRIAQKPEIEHSSEKDPFVKNGCFVKVQWDDSASSEEFDGYNHYEPKITFKELVEGYAAFNPHAAFILSGANHEAADTGWTKWRPDEPTSAHWYTLETLRDLIAAYVARDHGRTVREFVSEFRGLSATAKQKAIGYQNVHLSDLVNGNDLDMSQVESLLSKMKELSKPPKPEALGVIGKDAMVAWMVNYTDVSAESIRYAKHSGIDDGLPYVLEVAMGIRNNSEGGRRIVSGLNWSPTLVIPIQELGSLFGEMRVDRHDPVTVVVHIGSPRFDYVDRGKTRLQL